MRTPKNILGALALVFLTFTILPAAAGEKLDLADAAGNHAPRAGRSEVVLSGMIAAFAALLLLRRHSPQSP